jgi:hypothetical protein
MMRTTAGDSIAFRETSPSVLLAVMKAVSLIAQGWLFGARFEPEVAHHSAYSFPVSRCAAHPRTSASSVIDRTTMSG